MEDQQPQVKEIKQVEKKERGVRIRTGRCQRQSSEKQDEQMTTQNKRRDKTERERRGEGRRVDDGAKPGGRNA